MAFFCGFPYAMQITKRKRLRRLIEDNTFFRKTEIKPVFSPLWLVSWTSVRTVLPGNQSINQSIYQSINISINQLINPSAYQSINISISQTINQSISLSINWYFNQSIDKSIYKSVNQLINIYIGQPKNQSINYSINQSAWTLAGFCLTKSKLVHNSLFNICNKANVK